MTFTPFTSINVGDAYVTPEQRRRQYEREKKAKMIVPQPFRPSNPTQKGSGHGTMQAYGNFGTYEYRNQFSNADAAATLRKPLAPRNFLTSPPKKGTYGMVGMNIGGRFDGVCGELTYRWTRSTKNLMCASVCEMYGQADSVTLLVVGTRSSNPPVPKQRPQTTSDLRPFSPSSPAKRGE